MRLLEDFELWKPIPTVLTKIIIDYFIGDSHFIYCLPHRPWVSLEFTNSQPIRWKLTPKPYPFPRWCRYTTEWNNNQIMCAPTSLPRHQNYRILGHLIVCGGMLFHMCFEAPSLSFSCTKFDPAHQTWSPITQPKPNLGLGDGVAIVVVDDQIFCFGGMGSVNQVYNIRTNAWRIIADLPEARIGSAAIVFPNAKIIALLGGKISWLSTPTSSVLLYDIFRNQFTIASWKLPRPLFLFEARVHDQLLLISSSLTTRVPRDGAFMSFLNPGCWSYFRLQDSC